MSLTKIPPPPAPAAPTALKLVLKDVSLFYNYWVNMERGAWDRPLLDKRASPLNPHKRFVVFAPTNAAFQVLYI